MTWVIPLGTIQVIFLLKSDEMAFQTNPSQLFIKNELGFTYCINWSP